MATFKRYRDRSTGAIQMYPTSLAAVFPNLEEVDEDAKPLAYVPIPHSVVEDYLASASEPDYDASDDEEDEA
jgi:hypothetical protein